MVSRSLSICHRIITNWLKSILQSAFSESEKKRGRFKTIVVLFSFENKTEGFCLNFGISRCLLEVGRLSMIKKKSNSC